MRFDHKKDERSMEDKVLVTLSLIGLCVFNGIILYFVAEPDLIIVVCVCLFMAIYDFWISVFRPKTNDNNSDQNE